MEHVKLTDIRNTLEAVMDEITTSGDGDISNARLIERLRKEHSGLIERLAPQLISIALTKLTNEVANRKGPRIVSKNGEGLFGSYPGIPKVLSMGKGVKKSTLKTTFEEAEKWVKDHENKTIESQVKNEGFKKLIAEFAPYKQSPSDTIEQAMLRKREEEAGFLK